VTGSGHRQRGRAETTPPDSPRVRPQAAPGCGPRQGSPEDRRARAGPGHDALRCGEARASPMPDAHGNDGHGRSGPTRFGAAGRDGTEPPGSKDRRADHRSGCEALRCPAPAGGTDPWSVGPMPNTISSISQDRREGGCAAREVNRTTGERTRRHRPTRFGAGGGERRTVRNVVFGHGGSEVVSRQGPRVPPRCRSRDRRGPRTRRQRGRQQAGPSGPAPLSLAQPPRSPDRHESGGPRRRCASVRRGRGQPARGVA
jgi:hypothetical protein